MSTTQQDIERRAYEIWEAEGRPDGQQLRHWFHAELALGAKAIQEDLARVGADADHGGQDTALGPEDNLPIGRLQAGETEQDEP